MQIEELVILLPCHSLEDFPIYLDAEQAAGLLAAWTAPWHPQLIAAAGKTPTWQRADDPPEQLAGRVLIVPRASHSLLRAGWASRAREEGGLPLLEIDDRRQLVGAALEGAGLTTEVPTDLAADFLSLGFLFLQVELLTRQMRYMSNIDEVHFQSEAVRAAQHAVQGDEKESRRHLNQCFEILAEARERFYPVDTYLVDLTLLADSTLGASLARELDEPQPLNVLLSGAVLETMANRSPKALERLRQRLSEATLTVVGGEYTETELPLLPLEDIARGLRQGADVYRRHLGSVPTVFGRRTFGLTPMLPMVLSRCGYRSALHFTLDDGRFPRSEQSRFQWEGLDGSMIEALGRLPLDVSEHDTFLRLPSRLGEAMDTDYVATTIFAHWPGTAVEWYDDLRRGHRYAPVLGRFVTLEEYFRTTDAPGTTSRFTPDDYRSPYLHQEVARGRKDPLTRVGARVEPALFREAAAALKCFAAVARVAGGDDDAPLSSPAEPRDGDVVRSAAEELAKAVAGPTMPDGGLLALNPHVAKRPFPADTEAAAQAATAGVDVPGCGYAWSEPILPSKPPRARRRGRPRPLAKDNVLRNEFFEILIDPTTGALRSLHQPGYRGNRLSQQLALRQPFQRPAATGWAGENAEAHYSVMAADSCEVVQDGPVVGEIRVAGRLLDRQGGLLATFEQSTRVERYSPIVCFDIRLEPQHLPDGDPWENYYAARFAWPDSGADVRRSLHGVAVPTEASRIESPWFVDVRHPPHSTTILCGVLAYHRRVELRKLDTLLMVRGESRRRFRLAVAIDRPHPAAEVRGWVCPPALLPGRARPSAGERGWFFHLDTSAVVATDWQPRFELGQLTGCRLRLLETSGRPARLRLSTPRPLAGVRQVDLLGQPICELPHEGDAAAVVLSPYEWVQLELEFARGRSG